MIFRHLDDGFLLDLKDKKQTLHFILDFERKRRKSFLVEIRDNFLDLYFLGHGIEVKKRYDAYYLIASQEFNPKESLKKTPRNIVKSYGKSKNKWQICFTDIKQYDWFEEIMSEVLAQIVRHRKGNISEGVSEVNHFIDNRAIGNNGILIIDRQVAYPRSEKGRIDLLGLRRLPSGKFTFSVIELKNKNNNEIRYVFTRQLKRYIDLVYEKYEDFFKTYTIVLKQKADLGLLKLKPIGCTIAPKSEISKKDIEGIAILDNYPMRDDLIRRPKGLLSQALADWSEVGSEYSMKLFFKTNIMDSALFLDRNEAEILLNKYKSYNS